MRGSDGRRASRLYDPLMLECSFWIESLGRIPMQALLDKVKEEWIVASQGLAEILCACLAFLASRIAHNARFTTTIKEEIASLAQLDQLWIRHAQHLHDTSQLLLLILTWEDGHTRVQFRNDAAQTPHIDRHGIIKTQYDLW